MKIINNSPWAILYVLGSLVAWASFPSSGAGRDALKSSLPGWVYWLWWFLARKFAAAIVTLLWFIFAACIFYLGDVKEGRLFFVLRECVAILGMLPFAYLVLYSSCEEYFRVRERKKRKQQKK